MRPWCNGSMTGSNPVGQGSSPWGRACERTFARKRAHRPTGRRRLRTLEIRVRLPVGPLHNTVLWPSGEGSSLTRRRPGVRVHSRTTWPRYANWQSRLRLRTRDAVRFDSHLSHCEQLRPRGAAGVLASLSRRRSWVQIPSRTLDNWHGTQPAKRPSSNLRDLWVRLPPVLLIGSCSSAAACKASCRKTSGVGRREVQFLHDPLNTARSSSGSGCWPLSRQRGFDSRTGHVLFASETRFIDINAVRAVLDNAFGQVVELVDTRRSERRAHRAWEFDSPLGHFIAGGQVPNWLS